MFAPAADADKRESAAGVIAPGDHCLRNRPETTVCHTSTAMFELFTERARQVVVLAQDESRRLNHGFIGTEHLLLGLVREREGLAARALAALGLDEDEVRADVVRIVGTGEKPQLGQIPFTPRAKKVLELAKREARSLGHNYIGTEHVLLGLVAENEGVGMRILADRGAHADTVRRETFRMLSSPGGRRAVAPAVPAHPQLAIACPECGDELERIEADRPNVRLEVRAEGDRTCPGCGRRWTVSYAVSWTRQPD
jgi:ATP-dependent Clp protease ATP-binding subunit ClpA